MSGDHETEERDFSSAWRQHRAYLVNLAFRMLGDIGDAEDIVQDAFSRLLRSDRSQINDERGWLIVVTSRLCLDHMRSARSRREQYHQPDVLEAVARDTAPGLVDPADRVTLDDSVRFALLVMLEQLSPAERVVFVLHDMFQMPFESIAETVGRSAAACRQLASRARSRIEDHSSDGRFVVDSNEHRLVSEKFIAACAGGDLGALLEVLDADVVGEIDFGGSMPPGRAAGATEVSGNLLRFWGDATLVSQPMDGKAGILAFKDRALVGVFVLTIADERINHIHAMANAAAFRPDRRDTRRGSRGVGETVNDAPDGDGPAGSDRDRL